MDYDEILQNTGDFVANLSEKTLSFFSDQAGTTPTNLSAKLFSLFLIILLIFFSTKITNKLAKFGLIVVGILLAISVLISFF